jgi:hypothetical protein
MPRFEGMGFVAEVRAGGRGESLWVDLFVGCIVVLFFSQEVEIVESGEQDKKRETRGAAANQHKAVHDVGQCVFRKERGTRREWEYP